MIQDAHKHVALVDNLRNLVTGPAQEIGDERLNPERFSVDRQSPAEERQVHCVDHLPWYVSGNTSSGIYKYFGQRLKGKETAKVEGSLVSCKHGYVACL